MRTHIVQSLREAQAALEALLSREDVLEKISAAGEMLAEIFQSGGRVFSCGNGGSMCDAIHLAEELSGRYRQDRKSLPAIAISDPGHLSCVANDYGYDFVFSRYLEGQATSGDGLLAISTSGRSRNIIKAAQAARRLGIKSIALTGRSDSELGGLVDVDICTPAGAYADRVQELHIKIIHVLIELVERRLFPDNYPKDTV
jgi:D-sedoheptulose 7-phosphate isomerase